TAGSRSQTGGQEPGSVSCSLEFGLVPRALAWSIPPRAVTRGPKARPISAWGNAPVTVSPECCRPRQQQRFYSQNTGTPPDLARTQSRCARGRAHSAKQIHGLV